MAVQEHQFANGADLAAALAARVADLLRAALAQYPQASLAVSGGRSPIPFFRHLSEAELDWACVTITLVDERWVALEHPDSNEALLRENLLRSRAASAQLVSLKTAAASPAEALAERTRALPQRPFDVVVLGMGEDGHTASLFPTSAGLAAALDPHGTARLVAIETPLPPNPQHPRISLTLRAILDGGAVLLSISGASKLAVYHQALADAPANRYPIGAFLQQDEKMIEVFIG